MAIICGRGNHKHETLADVRACYNGEPVKELPNTGPVSTVVEDEAPATEKQIGFLKSLADQKLPPADAKITKAAATSGHWGRRSISVEINRLKALPKLQPVVMANESQRDDQTPVDLEAGMYRLGETIYKVQVAVHGSGRPYAKRLSPTGYCKQIGCEDRQEFHDDVSHQFQPDWAFEYAPGAIKELQPEHRMSLDEAKAFGAIYGICCVCAATLTNEVSIEAGIGPVCGGRV